MVLKIYLNDVSCLCIVCVYVHVSAGTLRSQKGAAEPLELELTSVCGVSDRGMGS